MIKAPNSFRDKGLSLRMIFSNTGITKANVLPEPVTAFHDVDAKSSILLTQRAKGWTDLNYDVLVFHK